jgi:hypothetical protein
VVITKSRELRAFEKLSIYCGATDIEHWFFCNSAK